MCHLVINLKKYLQGLQGSWTIILILMITPGVVQYIEYSKLEHVLPEDALVKSNTRCPLCEMVNAECESDRDSW